MVSTVLVMVIMIVHGFIFTLPVCCCRLGSQQLL